MTTSHLLETLASGAGAASAILAAMAAVALLEAAIPLRARGRWNRAHLGPNLALTFVAFATNTLFGAALLAALFRLQGSGLGLLRLSPAAFWSMTPRELAAALRALLGPAADEPPPRAALAQLMARFPDR